MRPFILLSAPAICIELGERCKAVRLLRNLTQLQLAQMVNVSLSSIRRFEVSGQSTLEVFVKVTQALQVVQQLEPLLTEQGLSISDLEKQQTVQKRRRARNRARL